MTHAEASGKRGRKLRDKFGITTIPALVLLDGEGALLCGKAHDMLRDDPTGKYFPWQKPTAAPRIPRVGYDLVDTSRPDVATPLPHPPGSPPQFVSPNKLESVTKSQSVAETVLARGIVKNHRNGDPTPLTTGPGHDLPPSPTQSGRHPPERPRWRWPL